MTPPCRPSFPLHRVGIVAALLLLVSACAFAGELPNPPAMTSWQAVLLGLVEGVTEYLPVSSTGHLLLTRSLLGIGTGLSKEAMDAYLICIQAGAILAVLVLYAGRVRSVFAGFLGKDRQGMRLGINILVGFIPAVIAGLVLEDIIKKYLFESLGLITLAWLVGGVAILLVSRKHNAEPSVGKQLEDLTPLQALAIGGLQCVAMWPGVSRSLMTILGGMVVGLSAVAAVEFSFLLGLVTLTAATALDALKEGGSIVAHYGYLNPIIGFVVAGVSAFLAVKWMVGYLNRRGLAVFGWYRLALGIIVAGLLFLQIVR